jgi:hypothetical protein
MSGRNNVSDIFLRVLTNDDYLFLLDPFWRVVADNVILSNLPAEEAKQLIEAFWRISLKHSHPTEFQSCCQVRRAEQRQRIYLLYSVIAFMAIYILLMIFDCSNAVHYA